jgi:hypothetical protein
MILFSQYSHVLEAGCQVRVLLLGQILVARLLLVAAVSIRVVKCRGHAAEPWFGVVRSCAGFICLSLNFC